MTLEQLQANTPFSSWAGHVDPKAIEASRHIYKRTIDMLVRIGTGKPKDSYLPVLNKYIEDFNALDDQYEFIETVEREDICECLAEVLDILKLPDINDCDDLPAVRNW